MNRRRGPIVKRCAACLVLAAVAAATLPALMGSRGNAHAQRLAQEQYENQVRYQPRQLPVGSIDQIFARTR